MCEPISIITGIASAATSYSGQKAAADAQEKAQAQASEAEQIRAGKANTAVRLRQAQESVARAQRKDAAQIKGMAAKSSTTLSALTEGGVGGRTLDMLERDLAAQEARYQFSEDRQTNLQATQAAFAFEEEASRTMMNQLRINRPIKQASLLQSGLQGLQTGMSMYGVTKDMGAPEEVNKALAGDPVGAGGGSSYPIVNTGAPVGPGMLPQVGTMPQ
jgi:hypothetical protein